MGQGLLCANSATTQRRISNESCRSAEAMSCKPIQVYILWIKTAKPSLKEHLESFEINQKMIWMGLSDRVIQLCPHSFTLFLGRWM